MSKSKKPLVLILLLAAAGAGVGYYVDTTRAPRDPNLLRIWGNIEVISAELSFKIPGRVIRRPVDEGQMVRLGQLVAVLDSNDLADQVAVRDGELGAAKAARQFRVVHGAEELQFLGFPGLRRLPVKGGNCSQPSLVADLACRHP